MLNGIDHIVIVVADLNNAIKNYTGLGFMVTPGGKHPIGSENALIPFKDGSYIELIAFTVSDSGLWWQEHLKNGGGIVDFCARCDNLRKQRELFRKAGIAMDEPRPLSRQRPDGYVLNWVLSIPQPPWSGIVPFLIEDITPREERVPSDRQHTNGVKAIDSITLAVSDAKALAAFYETVLGEKSEPVNLPEVNAAGFRVKLGPQTCLLVSPTSDAGPIAEWLKTRGPSPYAAALATSSQRSGALDMAKCENARLSFAQV
jgi:catechol 2,3-dioxygenase-like lactoylglutathione lyase family enzyme